jgi:hypothetical protein
MSYAGSRSNLYRQMAVYVDKLLRGAKPLTCPSSSPKPELIINLTAKALGPRFRSRSCCGRTRIEDGPPRVPAGAAALLAAPLAAEAQQAGKMPRMGFSTSPPPSPFFEMLRQGLRDPDTSRVRTSPSSAGALRASSSGFRPCG